jgi:hypothetical protein
MEALSIPNIIFKAIGQNMSTVNDLYSNQVTGSSLKKSDNNFSSIAVININNNNINNKTNGLTNLSQSSTSVDEAMIMLFFISIFCSRSVSSFADIKSIIITMVFKHLNISLTHVLLPLWVLLGKRCQMTIQEKSYYCSKRKIWSQLK